MDDLSDHGGQHFGLFFYLSCFVKDRNECFVTSVDSLSLGALGKHKPVYDGR
jgi:hypothetical protein